MSTHTLPRLLWPWFVVLITPFFFSTNIIFGKDAVADIAPYTLAFLRWFFVALILLPFMLKDKTKAINFVRNDTGLWLILGFLSMWICGGLFYYALNFTTAIHASLIYSTSPVWGILIQFIWYKRPIKIREVIGIAVAFIGVCYILLEGAPERLFTLKLNFGDILTMVCSIAWAVYAVLQKNDKTEQLSSITTLGLVAISGAMLLAPFAVYELVSGAPMPVTVSSWSSIAGIVFFASLLAFICVQYSIKQLGPTVMLLSQYLLPIFGTLLAVVLLGEEYHLYHFIGMVLALGGVVLASAPTGKQQSRT